MMHPSRELIIAGSNKCGTTSVFRYLAAHPAVLPSLRKETGFFNRRICDEERARKDFEALFPPSDAGHAWMLEATPGYLDRGIDVARRMRNVLENPRIMFLLRDPVDRFASLYRSAQGLTWSPATVLSLDEYLHDQLRAAHANADDTDELQTDGHELRKGRYALMLRQYLEVFRPEQILITFYEDLARDSREFMRRLCESLQIDPSFYDDFEFRIENRSRFHRSPRLRTLATKTNLKLEPLLNRVPAARRMVRAAYNVVNTSHKRRATLDSRQRAELGGYFVEPNARLRDLLQENFPGMDLPEWLNA
jgi:hypothetical protein